MKNTFTISNLLFLFFFLLSISGFSQNAPTAFTAGARTISTLDFSWTDGGGGDVFVVARHTAAIAGNPTNGNTYVVGDAIGTAKVVYIGSAANFSDDFSTNGPAVPGTQYFYKIWNRKNTGDLFSSGLTGSLFTISSVPSNQVTLAAFSNITNTAIRANWTEATGTAGTGTNRLVIVKKGSAVDATPTDGVSYTANAAFGTGGTEIGPAGNFVVYNGTALNVTVTGLTNGDYFFKVFTFNGSAGTENYLTGTPGVEANQGTNPSAQPTGLAFSTLLGNGQGYTLTWTPVPATTVDGYIVIRKIGSAPTNAPADGNTTYTVGNEIVASSGEFVAFIGSAATFNESTLAPTTNYFYRVYSYNGSGSGINYNATTPLGGNRITLRTEPTGQSTDITFASVTNTTMSVDWTKAGAGAGNNMIVIGKAGSAPTAPTDGNTYTANLAFGTGGPSSSTDGGSSFVVYKGSADSPITVTGLSPDTEYFFRAFEFNSTTALDENYNAATGTNNDGTQKQATTNEPINQVTGPATPFANITGTTIRVTWTAAVAGALAPTNYLVNAINKTAAGTYKSVADGTAVTNDLDLSTATGGNDGAQNITVGTNLANWSGLDPGQEYEFQIYSYRTSSAALNPDFKTTTPATVSGFTEPGAHTAITFGTIDNSSIAINLSAVSSAAGVVVLRRSGSAPTAPTIADGTVYTVGATNIAGGTNEVVYVGPISNFVDNDAGNGLNSSTAYYYIAFTYSGSGSKINYLTSGIPAAVNATTLAGGATTTVTTATGGEAATIPSTTTTSPGVSVFNFTVVDDAGSSAKTKITDIVINRKDLVSGDINDWSAVIGGARLSGSHGNTGTTGITAISVAPGPNITANSITFSGIPVTAEALGELDNGETLTYTLEVWLKPSLGSATIDGLNFVFQVTPNSSSFTTTSGDSFDTSGSAIESGNTNNVVSVVADRIRITTQPSIAVNASAVLAQQPVFEATDVNNNRDLGFNNAVASVNTGAPANLGPVYTPFNFVSGVATFSDLRFNNVGSSTMTITANSIVSSPASNSITVSASTNLSGGGLVGINAGPNLINSTTNQAVFGFTLTTTGSTLNFTDATITTTSDPDVAFKPSSIRLFRSTDNSISTGGDNTLISSTYTTPGNSIDFSPFSTSINGTTSNFFIVVDIQDFYPTSLPTIQLSLTNADFTVSTGGKTGSTQTGVNYTLQDNTPPTVLSIVPVLSNNGPNGISATSSLTYTVTFSEPVTGVSASDFVTTSNPLVGTLAFPPVTVSPPASNGISGSGTTYTVTVNGVTGTGQLRLDLVANASIVDPQPNGNVTGFTTGSSYNVILPEPTNDNTNFSATTPALNPNSSVTIDWKNPAGGQRPTHILIVGILNGVGTFPPVNDASLVAPSGNWNTSHGAVVVDYTGSYPSIPANDSYTIDNLLLSGKQYDFRIYPYTLSLNNSNNNVDYKTTSVLSGSYTIPLASSGTIIAGTTPPTATISSVLAGSNTVFSFKIVDDGGTSADNAPTLISNLVINKTTLGLNTIANWTDAIASAQLVDITQNSGSPIAGTVGANSISFALTTASGNPGYIGQNLTKEYQLRITLKNPFTASLDNQRFDFTINPAIAGSITYEAGSSKIAGGELENSGGETIQVNSTALRFTTQPAPTAQLILKDFSTSPIIQAVDANGNVDVDFTGIAKNVTITTPGSTTRMNNPGTDVTSFVLTPVNGVIDFNVLAPNLQYNDTNSGAINGTLVATGGGLSSTSGAGFVACSSITVDYSQTSTIGSATGISTISSIAATSVNVFTFTLTDDGGAGGDGAATKISSLKFTPNGSNQFTNFQDLMASATLSDGTNTQTITSATGLNTIDLTFSAIANGPGNLGNVPDSNSKIYTLSIVLKTPLLGGSLPSTADNIKLVLDLIRNPNITFNATGSTIPVAAPTINSGTSNGVFQVFATKLEFTTQPAASYLVNIPLSAQGTQPVVEARDARNNRDLDYTAPVTTTTSVVSRSGQPTTFRSNVPVGNGGIITGGAGVAFGFGDMQFTTIGTGAAITVTSTTPNANAVIPTAAVSTSFNVQVGQSSTISTPASLASIPSTATTSGSAVPVFSFKITDDAVGQNDGNPTLVKQIVFTQSTNGTINSAGLADWRDAIAGAILSDGNTLNDKIITSASITANTITFSGILIGNGQLGYITDSPTLGSSSKTYFLSIWLKSPLATPLPITIDGLKFGFDVRLTTDVLTDVNGTQIVSGNAITPSGNTVNVVATKLNYMTLAPTGTPVIGTNASAFSAVPSAPFQASGYVYTPFSSPNAIGVEAVDVNGNRDLNFNGTISTFSVANGLTYTKHPLDATSAGKVFSGGTFPFDPNFVYTTGDNQDGSITMSTTGPVLSNQTSPAINIQSSKDSYVYFDPNFAAQNFNKFVNQQAVTLPNTANTTVATLARVVLSDGGAANHNLTPTNYPFGGDSDKAFTRISAIQFSVTGTGTGDLRALALYNSAGNKISSDVPAGGTVSFTGLNIEAADDDTVKFTLRGSFKDTPVTDGDKITFAISGVTWAAGSFPLNYNGGAGPYFGGVNGGDISKQNNVDVEATSLDFTTQPSAFAGVNEPITPINNGGQTGVVKARDKFANLDTDFSFGYTMNTAGGAGIAAITGFPTKFTSGILDLTGMRYNSTGSGLFAKGNGTLTVIANGINSNTISSSNSKPCDRVDVIDVGATKNTTGVTTSSNLKGGTTATIFGVDITPSYFISTTKGDVSVIKNNEPSLNSLTFSFDVPYKTPTRTTLKNFRIFERFESAGSFTNLTDVTTLTGTVTQLESSSGTGNYDQVKVTFSTPRPLFTSGTQSSPTRSYFLQTDIDITATNNTPKITPQLIDNGYGDNRIQITQGSTSASFSGSQFGFASTRPPSLVPSNCVPFSGQLNVDSGITFIDLAFDVPVLTFDGVAYLYDRQNNVLKATLKATNGLFKEGVTTGGTLSAIPPVSKIRFSIPTGTVLHPDSVYYVKVPQGTFDPTALGGKGKGTGISDDQQNLYGGISYNGTMYFKIESNKPPVMISTDFAKYETNTKVASLNASFDQKGRAYYLILQSGTYNSVAPTAGQIFNPNTYTVSGAVKVANGSFNIDQLAPNLQFFSVSANFTGGTTYDVWIYAENDAQPAVASAPYGGFSNDDNLKYKAGLPGPTFTFTVPLSPGIPIYQLCPNSYSVLTQPIILTETANNEWDLGSQSFNILLPSGFNYDTLKPTVKLIGADFGALNATTTFINSTLLQVNFSNSGSISLDQIIISGMRVAPTTAGANGDIKRFAGAGLPNYGDGTVLAKLTAIPLAPQTFTNSYTVYNNFTSSIGLSSVVTSIPDNFFDLGLNKNAIKLIPTITPSNDYNASFFSGSGVTDDVLSLSGVSKNTAFDITMNHTDLNGCFLSQTSQYVVYDHTKIIPVLTDVTYGPKQAIVNSKYILPSDVNKPGKISGSLKSIAALKYNDIAGYNLEQMVLKVPKEVTSQSKLVTSNSQIIYGAGWQKQLDSVLQVVKTTTLPNGTFYDYQWDYAPVLRAKSSGSIPTDPYENFKDKTTIKGQDYYTGGSLGYVDFIGKFKSTADATVSQPLVQRIQLFVPPIPVIEAVGQSKVITATGKPDLNIFCRLDADIVFNGFPAASPGKSKAYFSLYDSLTGVVLYDGKNPTAAMLNKGFTDNANSNGTATLTPNSATFLNGYNTIRVEYTYQDDNSPASGTGTFYIQIARNPVADFTFTSSGANAPNASNVNSICVNNEITFTPNVTNPKYTYNWNFADGTANTTTIIPVHNYAKSLTYQASLSFVSDNNCSSIPTALATVVAPTVKDVKVGELPIVNFSFFGNCVGTDISFIDESTTPKPGNSDPAFAAWNFGDGATTPNTVAGSTSKHKYGTAKTYNVTLTSTTDLGCKDSKSKFVGQLLLVKATQLAEFEEKFDGANNTKPLNGGWITLDINPANSDPKPKAPFSNGVSSWKYDSAKGNWTTTAGYKQEKSALYSACLDLDSIARPVISFDASVKLNDGEGIVLQYSTDNLNIQDPKKNWQVLGTLPSGISPGLDWYNLSALASNPGTGYANSQNPTALGWAGDLGVLQPKHKLEDVGTNSEVILRFAFSSIGSGGNGTTNGVTIDNIRVGSRTRTVLFENFTTTDVGSGSPTLNTVLKDEADYITKFTNENINSTQLVNINYHVGFLGKDPFNALNAADPSSRALYYNVSQVPYAFLDGLHNQYKNSSSLFKDWGKGAYDLQTLNLANADFKVTGNSTKVTTNNTDGTISVEVNVTPIKDLPKSTTLFIGVLEDQVKKNQLPGTASITTGEDEFNYVLRKMLPDAVGTRYSDGTFKKGVSVRLGPNGKTNTAAEKFTWMASKVFGSKLTVVVFLQDSTKQVYQADLFQNIDPPGITTGLEPLSPESVNIYPNPANQEFVIELPQALSVDANVTLVDQMGRTLDGGLIPAGRTNKSVGTYDLAAGVYIVQIKSDSGDIVRKKVVIVH